MASSRVSGNQRARLSHRHGDLLQRAGAGEAAVARSQYLARVSQGGFDTDVVLGARVADHGWGLGYMLNQRGIGMLNLSTLRPWLRAARFVFVDLEHQIGYAYVMNRFDATKCNADPRSVVLSDAVYSALGVTRDESADGYSGFLSNAWDAMNGALLVLIVLVVAAIGVAVYASQASASAAHPLAGQGKGMPVASSNASAAKC